MKKLLLPPLTGIFLTALFLSGCGTIKIISSDTTVSEGDTAVIYPYSQERGKLDGVMLQLKSLDGGKPPKGFRTERPLRVPAGKHTFTADAQWFSGLIVPRPESDGGPYRTYFSAKKTEFTYDFKAGVSYYLEPVLGGGEGARVRMPAITLSFLRPKREGGEPFIGKIAIYSVTQYDKQGFPLVTADNLIEAIDFNREVSF